jgi:hypothetical protein
MGSYVVCVVSLRSTTLGLTRSRFAPLSASTDGSDAKQILLENKKTAVRKDCCLDGTEQRGVPL